MPADALISISIGSSLFLKIAPLHGCVTDLLSFKILLSPLFGRGRMCFCYYHSFMEFGRWFVDRSRLLRHFICSCSFVCILIIQDVYRPHASKSIMSLNIVTWKHHFYILHIRDKRLKKQQQGAATSGIVTIYISPFCTIRYSFDFTND